MTRNIIDAKTSFQFDNLKINLIRVNYSLINFNYPRHSHGKRFYELHCIDGGRGRLITDSGEFPIEKGSLIMTGPLIVHEQITDASDPMSEFCFEFEIIENTRRKPSRESELLKNTTLWVGEDSRNICEKFRRLYAENAAHNIGYSHAVGAIVTEILVDLIRSYSGCAEPQEYPRVNLNDKRTLITDEVFLFEYATITLDSLSARLGLSRRQTERFLREAYGKSFIVLRKEKRLEKAKELLKSGMSPAEAAERVGYEKPQSLKNI